MLKRSCPRRRASMSRGKGFSPTLMLTHDAPIESIVFFEVTERDSAGNRWAVGAAVGEEGAGGLRLVLWLMVHVSEDFDWRRSGRRAAASARGDQKRDQEHQRGGFHVPFPHTDGPQPKRGAWPPSDEAR